MYFPDYFDLTDYIDLFYFLFLFPLLLLLIKGMTPTITAIKKMMSHLLKI